uniref:Uncharacterized protein n=1 Tax=viral metagenome TaxID=1070528 RepID=A0A6C0B0K5_9ZZZZ
MLSLEKIQQQQQQQTQTQQQIKQNYNHVLDLLQDYMLDKKVLSITSCNKQYTVVHEKNKQQKEEKEGEKMKKEEEKKEVERFFIPKEKDQLFWCYFIIHHGFIKYEYPGTTSFVNEKTEKFKCIDLLRLNKQQLKIKKIKNIKEDVEDELANKQSIGMKTFIALCVASNINIMYIHKYKRFEIIFDETQPIHVVHCIPNKDLSYFNYKYEMNPTKEQIEEYRNTLFSWENVDKPLKAMSAYKLNELQDLCEKFKFDKDTLKQKTKKELYEYLIMNI